MIGLAVVVCGGKEGGKGRRWYKSTFSDFDLGHALAGLGFPW